MEQSQQRVASIVLAEGGGAAAAVVPLSRQQETDAAPLLQGSTADPFARIDAAALAANKLSPTQRTALGAQEDTLRSLLGLAFNDLGTSEAIRREYVRALSSYQQAERWDSTLPGLQKNLGQCAFRAGRYPEAIAGLAQALEQNPETPAVRAQLGMAYFATNQYTQAAQTFAPLGEQGMEDGEIGYAWAAALAHTGDMKRASEVLGVYEPRAHGGETLLLLGQLWTEIGDYARATSTLQRASSRNPSLLKAHFYSGLAYIRWERWPEAVQQFQEELRLSPRDPDAQYHLGFVYMQQSKVEWIARCFVPVKS